MRNFRKSVLPNRIIMMAFTFGLTIMPADYVLRILHYFGKERFQPPGNKLHK
jgi:hypothetical protein